MVDIRPEQRRLLTGRGWKRKNFHGVEIQCYFNNELFDQVRAEAVKRGWTLAHMVRHLCEASIEGIE